MTGSSTLLKKNVLKLSIVANLLVAAFASAHGEEPERYALLIAVTDYKAAEMNEPELKYPEIDAKSIGEFLERCGYSVEYLLGPKANKEAIERKLESLQGKSNESGTAIIGLWGHGVDFALSEETMFCPFDTRIRFAFDSKSKPVFDDSGKRLLEPDPDSLVGMSKILRGLKKCGAGNSLLIADCCRTNVNRLKGKAFGSNITVNELPDNSAAIFACGVDEVAFEHESWGHGALAKSFLNQLEAMAGDNKSEIIPKIDRLKLEVAEMVREVSNGRKTQTISSTAKGRPDLLLKSPTPPTFNALQGGSNKQAVTLQRSWAKHLGESVEFKNKIGMTFVLIPPGEFIMGSLKSADELATDAGIDATNFRDEHPRHRVKISQPYFLGKYEVTQKQWRDLMNTQPWLFRGGAPQLNVEIGDDFPATCISWDDAIGYCKKLSELEGVKYRLPTEAEWEYACRAGTNTTYNFDISKQELGDHAWYKNNTIATGKSHARQIGQKRANPFGLHDMYGNAWEWCSDWHGVDYYAKSAETDPAGPDTGSFKVLRGSGWSDPAWRCRSAQRNYFPPEDGLFEFGFRVLRVSAPKDKSAIRRP